MSSSMDERRDDPMADLVLDGNAVAGMMAAVFGSDMTAIPGRCANCHDMHMVGAMRAYVHGPGAVLRCPSCGEVVLRIVETIEATYVDVRGASYLRFARR